MKKQLTLTIIHQSSRILLGMKKRGFGIGRWNGFGGKIEASESIEEAAKRELFEEVGIQALDLEKMGILNFEFQNNLEILEVHVFKVKNFSGELLETEEMKPQWFDIDKIPFDSMWPDDIYWLPYFLEDKKFEGRFLFDRPSDAEYQAKILSMDLREI